MSGLFNELPKRRDLKIGEQPVAVRSGPTRPNLPAERGEYLVRGTVPSGSVYAVTEKGGS
ncbi:hypothetical protein M2302_004163 [Micromonospora sp. A200]|uniref:hypothetical protein n=1 Tax=Micromonospora sp. A200 TaxID=2940568 RepID=UPI002475179A|nr:hypothetical protein [Micromonospora sp. A200]MDH6463966.1 hypothetical protein [Micromonospora sp. A200]